ncbi:IPTL-CTERM sorting domain-containing protein [Pseudomonadota bacterium]
MNRNTKKNYLFKNMKRVGTASLVLLVSALLLAGQAFAQTCPADLNVSLNGNEGPYELGEEIPVKLTISYAYEPTTTYLEVRHFQYLLDCASNDTFPTPGCTWQGNTVTFIPSNVDGAGTVDTTCKLEDGSTPAIVLSEQNGEVTIDFNSLSSLAPPTSAPIRLNRPAEGQLNTCEVTFKVRVDALADANSTDPIYEFSSWSGLDAYCDGVEEANSTVSDDLTIPITNPNVVIWVTKDFSDDKKTPVNVHMYCDAGIYTNPDAQITDPETGGNFPIVGFVTYGIPSIGANCWVYEDPVPTGYSDGYVSGAFPNALYDSLYSVNKGDETDEPRGCYFKAVKGGEFTCDITDNAKPGEFTVTKEWEVDPNHPGIPVKEKAEVTATCDHEITKVEPIVEPEAAEAFVVVPTYSITEDLGDGESLIVSVDTLAGPASCWATEKLYQSGVESDDNCGKRTISAGGKSECTIVNTVFFEGIPTLSQYGVALMALLMLGFGVLGLRRFA